MTKEIKKITLGLVLSWVLGVLFLVNGFAFLFEGVIITGVSLILASLILLPPINNLVKEKFNFELSGGLKVVLVIILLIIGGLNLPSSFNQEKMVQKKFPQKTALPQNQTQTSENQPQTPPVELNLNIGETAKTSKVEVTVFSAKKTKSYNYYSDVFKTNVTEEAKPGKIFILVDAEIKNVGSDRVFVGASEFSITDSEGYKYDPIPYLGSDELETIKELYQNQKMRGKILFEVPEKAQNLRLQYDFGDLFIGTKLASWSIK